MPTHVEFRRGEFTPGLGTVETAKRAQGGDASPGSPVMTLVLRTEDVDGEFVRLAAAGVPAVQPATTPVATIVTHSSKTLTETSSI